MKKKKKQKSFSIFASLFVTFILIIVLISTVLGDYLTVSRNIKKTNDLKEKYDLLKEEEESLNVEITKLQDPDYIARYAREKYMYSKDGEFILRIVGEDEEKEE